ncbi:MAG TPA: DUF1569 domain-containing protein [Longimicrobiaceae bacterium]|nr:DUF1569 domain-containing protein [Longimicrobiaceae bacterium]
MKNLFDAARAAEIQQRIASLGADSPPQWGRMNAAQAMAHCAAGLAMATGDVRPPRALAGRIFGAVVKRLALRDDEPMRRNAPTVASLQVADERDLSVEQARLQSLVAAFAAVGSAGCTTHPHPFFGKLTPDEWGVLMYKHLDHHLRQFGA